MGSVILVCFAMLMVAGIDVPYWACVLIGGAAGVMFVDDFR